MWSEFLFYNASVRKVKNRCETHCINLLEFFSFWIFSERCERLATFGFLNTVCVV